MDKDKLIRTCELLDDAHKKKLIDFFAELVVAQVKVAANPRLSRLDKC